MTTTPKQLRYQSAWLYQMGSKPIDASPELAKYLSDYADTLEKLAKQDALLRECKTVVDMLYDAVEDTADVKWQAANRLRVKLREVKP
jgi:hypothetical protein